VAGALLGGLQCLEWPGNDHIDARAFQLCCLIWHQGSFAVSIARLHNETPPLDVAKLSHPLTKCVHVWIIGGRSASRHPANPHDGCRLLRARRERPSRRAAEKRDELAAFQLIERHPTPNEPGPGRTISD
jgi:hypothetical protein